MRLPELAEHRRDRREEYEEIEIQIFCCFMKRPRAGHFRTQHHVEAFLAQPVNTLILHNAGRVNYSADTRPSFGMKIFKESANLVFFCDVERGDVHGRPGT